jgi:hypothetical protein
LVVGVGREDFGLLGGYGGVTLDESSHDTTSSLNAKGKRGNIKEEKVLSLLGGIAGKDGSLDSSTISNSLVGVNALVGFFAVKEVGNEFHDTGDTGGTADQNDFMDVRFVDLRVTKDLLDGIKSATEEILAQLFEASTSKRGIEVDTLEERVNLNGSLSGRRQGTFGTLASSA